MAHSYIQAHDEEFASFESFAALYPQTTLLVDTYDTIEGVRKVVELSRKLGERFHVKSCTAGFRRLRQPGRTHAQDA